MVSSKPQYSLKRKWVHARLKKNNQLTSGLWDWRLGYGGQPAFPYDPRFCRRPATTRPSINMWVWSNGLETYTSIVRVQKFYRTLSHWRNEAKGGRVIRTGSRIPDKIKDWRRLRESRGLKLGCISHNEHVKFTPQRMSYLQIILERYCVSVSWMFLLERLIAALRVKCPESVIFTMTQKSCTIWGPARWVNLRIIYTKTCEPFCTSCKIIWILLVIVQGVFCRQWWWCFKVELCRLPGSRFIYRDFCIFVHDLFTQSLTHCNIIWMHRNARAQGCSGCQR